MTKHLFCILGFILLLGRFELSVAIWSLWTEWSSCNCAGKQERTRECYHYHPNSPPTPATDCQGHRLETILCTQDETLISSCHSGVWNAWSDWTNCTEQCGNNNRIRVRNCTNDEYTKLENSCQGHSVESLPCREINCTSQVSVMTTKPRDSWNNWSSWTICTATCGEGVKYRSRNCSTYDHIQVYDCNGPSVETVMCNDNVCAVPVMTTKPPDTNIWSSWNEWTTCTATCGGGGQFRERHCQLSMDSKANNCTGLSIESRRCATQVCAGVLSDWLSWTSCPTTCGAGIQFRERFCNYPGTTNISRHCHGETVEQKVCHLMDCPVDGMWGHWGEWGQCLAGRQMRSRKCDGPSPQHGGKQCYSDDNARDVETRTCDEITTPAPRVLEPPKIYGNASTVSGGNVSLLCLTTIAGVSVKWYYKENESLPLYAVQPQGTTHLIITGANVQNIGTYSCLIADKELSSKAHQEVTMGESAANIISLSAQPPHISDGATVQLECKALGYPEPIIRWGYKDTFGNPYVPPPVKYTDGGKTIVIASYQSILYGGTWTCNAANKLGADHRDITI